jgi:outer membrane murein-binding lipoprotein Lpp
MTKRKTTAAVGAEAVQTMSARESEHYREIRSLESTCDRLEGEYEAARSGAAAAKSLWSEAVSRLRECIRRGPDPQLPLPLADDFMQATIGAALTLTDRQFETLEDAGISTVQDFEDLRSGRYTDYPGGIQDLPGIGRAIADRWEDEILDWIGRQEQARHATAADECESCDSDLDDDGGDE